MNTLCTKIIGCFCVTQLKPHTLYKLSSSKFCGLWVCEGSVTPDQISTFSKIYRHTSPLLTLYHLIPSSTNFYWPSTSWYCHILTQYHQEPLIIQHLIRRSSANWIISLFTTHLMSRLQYTWSSCYRWNFLIRCIQVNLTMSDGNGEAVYTGEADTSTFSENAEWHLVRWGSHWTLNNPPI